MPEETKQSEKKALSPAEFLAKFMGPTEIQLNTWKEQVCNGRIQMVCPDNKRIWLMRAISGEEMRKLQTIAAGMGAQDPEFEYRLLAVAAACLWTNTSPDKHLSPELLKASGAGLPTTLFAVVAQLSDFFEPEQLDLMTVEI